LDADLSTEPPSTTAIEIFGEVYRVRGNEDPKRLRELAELVDRKMRDVAQHVNTADTARIAILAALNLADELFRAQEQQEGERVEIKEKAVALAEELTEALRG
jgi:cell division protein ZapA